MSRAMILKGLIIPVAIAWHIGCQKRGRVSCKQIQQFQKSILNIIYCTSRFKDLFLNINYRNMYVPLRLNLMLMGKPKKASKSLVAKYQLVT
jgi:hypothetical protein